jgi:hypothetical protein
MATRSLTLRSVCTTTPLAAVSTNAPSTFEVCARVRFVACSIPLTDMRIGSCAAALFSAYPYSNPMRVWYRDSPVAGDVSIGRYLHRVLELM